eukprot:TRINITY_DN58815_c0_g1_i2.p1 TRINITY_DN58815_c0_g1~~TRINITY_DN58815_c0_g1_i2.p1  ORF type:complete len:612 (+),score=174.49 TRINITY_DN58815_c0_g1_i2:182-1837(+)
MDITLDASSIGLPVASVEIGESTTPADLMHMIAEEYDLEPGTFMAYIDTHFLEHMESLEELSCGDVVEIRPEAGSVARKTLKAEHGISMDWQLRAHLTHLWSKSVSVTTDVDTRFLALAFESGYLGPSPYKVLFHYLARAQCTTFTYQDAWVRAAVSAGLTPSIYRDCLSAVAGLCSCMCTHSVGCGNPQSEEWQEKRLDLIQFLIDHGADTNSYEDPEDVPLVVCAKVRPKGFSTRVAAKLEAKAYPNVCIHVPHKRLFVSIPHAIVVNDNADMLRLLRENLLGELDVNVLDPTSGRSPLTLAASLDNTDMVRQLLELGAQVVHSGEEMERARREGRLSRFSNNHYSAVTWAVMRQNRRMLEDILAVRRAVEVHLAADSTGDTPLLVLAKEAASIMSCYSDPWEVSARLQDYQECIVMLMSHLRSVGSDAEVAGVVNQKDSSGFTALMKCAEARDPNSVLAMVRCLVEEGGADVRVATERGHTVLHSALLTLNINPDTDDHLAPVKYLLAAGADPDAVAVNKIASGARCSRTSLKASNIAKHRGFGQCFQ